MNTSTAVLKLSRRHRETADDKPLRLVKIKRVSRQGKRGKDNSDGQRVAFLSPEQQDKVIDDYCERFGHTIVASFDETKSVSGKTTQRVGLQEAIALVMSGAADGIIVAKVDRFARNVGEGLGAIKNLDEHGKVFIAVDEGIDTSRLSKMGRLMLGILLIVAEWYLESVSDSWGAVREHNIAAGIPNHVNWGYVRGPDRRMAPDPEVEKWAVRLFEERAAGRSWTDCAEFLNGQGVPTAGHKSASHNGRGAAVWSVSSVRAIITNRAYRGELHDGELCNPKAHPALVSEDLWQRANRKVVVTTPKEPHTVVLSALGWLIYGVPMTAKRKTYLLRGIVRCTSCGGTMAGNAEKFAPDVYRCSGWHSWGSCPAPARIRAEDLEGYVLDRFQADYIERRVITAVVSDAELVAAQAVVTEAEAAVEFFLSSGAIDRLRTTVGDVAADTALNERLDALDEARGAMAKVEADRLGVQLPTDLPDLWPELDLADRRRLLGAVYPVVAVEPAPVPPGVSMKEWRPDVASRVDLFDVAAAAALKLPGRGGGSGLCPIHLRLCNGEAKPGK